MLTLQQAYNNLKVATERATGTKNDHVAWERSLDMVHTVLFPTEENDEAINNLPTAE